jgi:hypothetical protein
MRHRTDRIYATNSIKLDPSKAKLSDEERSTLLNNIQIMRDAIVLFTATGAARGVSGHTGARPHSLASTRVFPNSLTHTYYYVLFDAIGGAYDTVPEVAILLSLFNFSDKFYPTVFDEAGA